MTRDELLGRVSDIIRRSGVEDGERLVVELEKKATAAAWGVPEDLIFVLSDPGENPIEDAPLSESPPGLVSGVALAMYHDRPTRKRTLTDIRYEIDHYLGAKYLWWRMRSGRRTVVPEWDDMSPAARLEAVMAAHAQGFITMDEARAALDTSSSQPHVNGEPPETK